MNLLLAQALIPLSNADEAAGALSKINKTTFFDELGNDFPTTPARYYYVAAQIGLARGDRQGALGLCKQAEAALAGKPGGKTLQQRIAQLAKLAQL